MARLGLEREVEVRHFGGDHDAVRRALGLRFGAGVHAPTGHAGLKLAAHLLKAPKQSIYKLFHSEK